MDKLKNFIEPSLDLGNCYDESVFMRVTSEQLEQSNAKVKATMTPKQIAMLDKLNGMATPEQLALLNEEELSL